MVSSTDSLRRARDLYQLLREEAPFIPLRELLEAVLGLKCSRVYVSRAGLDRLDGLSQTFGFGIALADYKTVHRAAAGKGNWAESVHRYTCLDDPDGLFTVYLGSTPERAELARLTEAELGDDAFGKLLDIPRCCRRFYLENRQKALAVGDDYLWLSLGDEPYDKPIPAGANVLAQYFDAGLLSHFPCSMTCHASRRASSKRRATLAFISKDFANRLAEAQRWSYLILRGRGMVAFVNANAHENEVFPDYDHPCCILGDVPEEFFSCDRLYTGQDRSVIGVRCGNELAREGYGLARLIGVGSAW